MTIYRLSWEIVKLNELWHYCNADPRMYGNVKQLTPNSQIPDEHWSPVQREGSDVMDQYNTLKAWESLDTNFVRNVKLEYATEPEWREVERP